MERYTRPRAYWGIILVILLVVVLQAVGALSFVMGPIASLIDRATGTTYAAGLKVRDSVANAVSGTDPAITDLEKTVENLRIENAKLRTLADENASLKAALDYRNESGRTGVTAQVISDLADDAHNALVIDRGSADGITVGLPVIVQDGVLIGKIAAVTERTASVLLLSDSKSAVAVGIQNEDGTLGVLQGDRGLSMSITLIPQTETITPGDIVVTSGIEPGIPRGLVAGTVDTLVRDTQDPFQSATVAPMSGTAHPTFVTVLVPQADPETPTASTP